MTTEINLTGGTLEVLLRSGGKDFDSFYVLVSPVSRRLKFLDPTIVEGGGCGEGEGKDLMILTAQSNDDDDDDDVDDGCNLITLFLEGRSGFFLHDHEMQVPGCAKGLQLVPKVRSRERREG